MMYNTNNYRNVEQQQQQQNVKQQPWQQQQNKQQQQNVQQPWQQHQNNVNKQQQQNVHFDLAPPTTSSNSSSGFLPFPTARQSLEKREEVDELAMLDEEEELVPDEPVIDSRQGNWFGDGDEAEEDEFVLLDDPVLIVEEPRRGNLNVSESRPYQPCYPSEEDLYGPEIAVLTPPKQVINAIHT
jgi:hypothetical protein